MCSMLPSAYPSSTASSLFNRLTLQLRSFWSQERTQDEWDVALSYEASTKRAMRPISARLSTFLPRKKPMVASQSVVIFKSEDLFLWFGRWSQRWHGHHLWQSTKTLMRASRLLKFMLRRHKLTMKSNTGSTLSTRKAVKNVLETRWQLFMKQFKTKISSTCGSTSTVSAKKWSGKTSRSWLTSLKRLCSAMAISWLTLMSALVSENLLIARRAAYCQLRVEWCALIAWTALTVQM